MICVYGTVCLDRVRRVDALPAKGGYAEIESETWMLGGEAANTAVALWAWGAEADLVGNPVGAGATADWLDQQVQEAGGRPLIHDEGPSPFCDVYVTPDGDRTMFGYGFVSMDERVAAFDRTAQPGEWATFDPNQTRCSRDAVRRAVDAGFRIYLEDFAEPDDEVPPGSVWQSSTDRVGSRGDRPGNADWAARWADRHGCTTILSDGHHGFVYAEPGQAPRWYPAFVCDRYVDSTGAGDVFRAGMLLGLSESWPRAEVLRFAAAAGCLNCESLGGSARRSRREEVLALMARQPDIAAAFD